MCACAVGCGCVPQVWTLGTVRKGNPQIPNEPLQLRNYPDAGPHPTEPGGWHMSYTLFAPSLYLKYIGMAEVGVSRAARNFPNISDVHSHVAFQRNVAQVRIRLYAVCGTGGQGSVQARVGAGRAQT